MLSFFYTEEKKLFPLPLVLPLFIGEGGEEDQTYLVYASTRHWSNNPRTHVLELLDSLVTRYPHCLPLCMRFD